MIRFQRQSGVSRQDEVNGMRTWRSGMQLSGFRGGRPGIFLLAVMVLVVVSATGCQKKETKTVEKIINVRTATVEKKSLRPFVEAVGTLKPPESHQPRSGRHVRSATGEGASGQGQVLRRSTKRLSPGPGAGGGCPNWRRHAGVLGSSSLLKDALYKAARHAAAVG